MTRLGFPWAIADDGGSARVDEHRHIRDLIELVLFTSPGERVNRPSFGSGLLQVVFGPASEEVAATAQVLAQSALQQWLGHLIELEALTVEHDDATLTVTVRYRIHADQERRVDSFTREI